MKLCLSLFFTFMLVFGGDQFLVSARDARGGNSFTRSGRVSSLQLARDRAAAAERGAAGQTAQMINAPRPPTRQPLTTRRTQTASQRQSRRCSSINEWAYIRCMRQGQGQRWG